MENDKKMEKIELSQKSKTILYILVYSFLGWTLETIFCLVTTGTFEKRGFLYGPLCPIYGFSAILMIDLLKRFKTNTIGKFFVCMIVFTVFEYVVAAVLDSLFHLRWWDYSNERFNFQGRISLPYSIAWGIIGVIFVEKIHPYVKRKIQNMIKNVNYKILYIVIYGCAGIVTVDFILSIVKYINMMPRPHMPI